MSDRPVAVLVVEDDPDVRGLLALVVSTAASCTLAGVAGSLAEGRALLLELDPDVALVDMGLPDGSGVELLSCDSRTKFVVLSAQVTYQHDSLLGAGAHAVLDKPCLPQQVVEAIQSAASQT